MLTSSVTIHWKRCKPPEKCRGSPDKMSGIAGKDKGNNHLKWFDGKGGANALDLTGCSVRMIDLWQVPVLIGVAFEVVTQVKSCPSMAFIWLQQAPFHLHACRSCGCGVSPSWTRSVVQPRGWFALSLVQQGGPLSSSCAGTGLALLSHRSVPLLHSHLPADIHALGSAAVASGGRQLLPLSGGRPKVTARYLCESRPSALTPPCCTPGCE